MQPITATQKVLIVCGVKHVEHEIRRSLKDFVTHFALFLPAIVDHRNQSRTSHSSADNWTLAITHTGHPGENRRFRLMHNAKSVSNAD